MHVRAMYRLRFVGGAVDVWSLDLMTGLLNLGRNVNLLPTSETLEGGRLRLFCVYDTSASKVQCGSRLPNFEGYTQVLAY